MISYTPGMVCNVLAKENKFNLLSDQACLVKVAEYCLCACMCVGVS